MSEAVARDETPCPACAEPILVVARKCKHCGVNVEDARRRLGNVRCHACGELTPGVERTCQHCHEPIDVTPALNRTAPRPEDEFGRYNAPVRLQQQTGTDGGGGTRPTSIDITIKGSVCPRCLSGDYVEAFSIWHGVVALLLFPLGLLVLALPVKRCVKCDKRYGAGRQISLVLGIGATCIAVPIVLFIAYLLWPSDRALNTPQRASSELHTSQPPVSTARTAAPPAPRGFQELAAPARASDAGTDVDLSKKVTDEADFSGKGGAAGASAVVVGDLGPARGDQPYFEFQVEKQVAAIPGQLGPQYPDMLKSGRVEGEVLAQYVVDTTGRYEAGTLKVLKSSHELFTQAVKDALPNMRFYPAEVGGRKVKQIVQQPFTFSLSKGN